MIRETFPVGMLGCNCTILGDEVVPGGDRYRSRRRDPAYSLGAGRASAHGSTNRDHPRTLRSHCGCAAAQGHHRRAHSLQPGGPSACGDHGGAANLDRPSCNSRRRPRSGSLPQPTARGYPFAVSKPRSLHTPGHTPGSVSLHLPAHNLLLAGDTRFAGGVGRSGLSAGQWTAAARQHPRTPAHAPGSHGGHPGPRPRHDYRRGTTQQSVPDITCSPVDETMLSSRRTGSAIHAGAVVRISPLGGAPTRPARFPGESTGSSQSVRREVRRTRPAGQQRLQPARPQRSPADPHSSEPTPRRPQPPCIASRCADVPPNRRSSASRFV